MSLRVLALTTSYPLREQSSSGVFVRNLYEHLPAPWRVVVLCPADTIPARQADSQEPRLVPVRYAPRPWQVLSQQAGGILAGLRAYPLRIVLVPLLLTALTLRAMFDSRRADIVHANWALCGAVAVVACLFTRRRVVTTFRGSDVASAKRSWPMRMLLSMAVLGSRELVCVSEAMSSELRRLYPAHAMKITTCLNGVDESFLSVSRARGEGASATLVSIGSLIPGKGYDVLISALGKLQPRGDVQLLIAGDGPERPALEAQVEALGLMEKVRFLGNLPPARIPSFLSEGDVFVFASRSEGRPNVVIEALASGLPVISTRLPGVDGLVHPDENGWLVEIDDADGLAAAIDAALSDPEATRAMGERAREGITAAGMTWAQTGRCYDAVFRRALARAATRSGTAR